MTSKARIAIILAALVVGAACVVRTGVTPAEATPFGVPRSTPRKAPGPPAVKEPPVAGPRSADSPSPSAPSAPAPTAAFPAAGSPIPAAGSPIPAAAASAYVFAPQQTTAARPSPAPSGSAPPEAAFPAPRGRAEHERPDSESGKSPGELRLAVVASVHEIETGAMVTVDVMASSTGAVVDAPLHLTFDPSVMEFVDGAPGDFLTQGGSSIVFLADAGSRPGDVAIASGRVEREHGASGTGLLCRARFRGVRAGTTPILVGDAKVWGVRGEALTVFAGGTNVVVH